MKNGLRFQYTDDVDRDIEQKVTRKGRISPCVVRSLKISEKELGGDGFDSLQAIEAERRIATDTMGGKRHLLRIRVIINAGLSEFGVNINLPCDSELQKEKYRDIRNQIRNHRCVRLHFKNLRVRCSKFVPGGLYFVADDYKMVDDSMPTLLI